MLIIVEDTIIPQQVAKADRYAPADFFVG